MDECFSGASLSRFLRLIQVESVTGLRKSAIYARIKAGKFPRPVPLGGINAAPNSPVGWLESEIVEWQRQLVQQRDKQPTMRNQKHGLRNG